MLLCILLGIMIVFSFIPLTTQNQFIFCLSFFGSYLVVEGLSMIILALHRKDVYLIGSSESLFVDILLFGFILILTILFNRFQKKVRFDFICDRSFIRQNSIISTSLELRFRRINAQRIGTCISLLRRGRRRRRRKRRCIC